MGFIKRIYHFDTINSTNEYAKRLALQGGEEGDIVISEEQTEGKGRIGKSWFSPKGENIYTSIILKPNISVDLLPLITIMAGVATVLSIEKFSSNISPKIKWPNDILINKKKVAGILTEGFNLGSSNQFIILGIGINVNIPIENFPKELKDKATSLFIEKKCKMDKEILLKTLYQEIDIWYNHLKCNNIEKIIEKWENYSCTLGKQVITEKTSGEAIGLDLTGALLIKDEQGVTKRIISGEIEES